MQVDLVIKKFEEVAKKKRQGVPPKPPVDLPTCKALPILGTLSQDSIRRDTAKAAEEKRLMEDAEK